MNRYTSKNSNRHSSYGNYPRKRRSHKPQLILEMAAVCILALSMSIMAVAAAAAAYDDAQLSETEKHTSVAEPQLLNYTVKDPVSTAARSVIDMTEPMKLIEPAQEDPGITTTRLGVTVTDYDPDTDYSAIISNLYTKVEEEDDPETVEQLLGLLEVYETQRNMKVDEMFPNDENYVITNTFSADNTAEEIDDIMNPSYYDYTQEELEKLAAIVYAEAGSSWCTDEHQQAVASVVINRVEDDRFPDTIHEVIYAPGQYPATCDNTYYDDRALTNAQAVLENGPTHDGIFQANFTQGSEIVEVYDYRSDGHSVTYICA